MPLLALGLDKPHIIDGSIARRAGDVDFIGLGVGGHATTNDEELEQDRQHMTSGLLFLFSSLAEHPPAHTKLRVAC